MADYFTGTNPLAAYQLPSSYSFPKFDTVDLSTFKGDFGDVFSRPEGILGSSAAPSPTQPGATPGATPGWGKQWGDLLTGVGHLAGGVGAAIAAAKGDPMAGHLAGGVGAGIAAAKGAPMAGQLLSAYFQEKTGDTDESGESSLVKALKALQESGMISPVKMDSFKLDTGDSSKLLA
jgi:hypothetical protein